MSILLLTCYGSSTRFCCYMKVHLTLFVLTACMLVYDGVRLTYMHWARSITADLLSCGELDAAVFTRPCRWRVTQILHLFVFTLCALSVYAFVQLKSDSAYVCFVDDIARCSSCAVDCTYGYESHSNNCSVCGKCLPSPCTVCVMPFSFSAHIWKRGCGVWPLIARRRSFDLNTVLMTRFLRTSRGTS